MRRKLGNKKKDYHIGTNFGTFNLIWRMAKFLKLNRSKNSTKPPNPPNQVRAKISSNKVVPFLLEV